MFFGNLTNSIDFCCIALSFDQIIQNWVLLFILVQWRHSSPESAFVLLIPICWDVTIKVIQEFVDS